MSLCWRPIAAIVLAFALAACSGGGGGAADPLPGDTTGDPAPTDPTPSDPAPSDPPPVVQYIRTGGQCYAICQTLSDPDGDGWGYENGASCVMPDTEYALNSPWCSTPLPLPPYEVTPATVDASVEHVAALLHTGDLTVDPPSECPYAQAGLSAWDPAWMDGNGVVTVPNGTKVLIHGNDDIAAGTLLRTITIPADSELIFADQDAVFRIRDVHVAGALRIGSPTCRLNSKIEFIFDTDEDVSGAEVRQQIYDRVGLGIVVEPGGVFEVFGKLYQPNWSRLNATATAGSTTVQTFNYVDWVPGQQVVVVTSNLRDYPYSDENEVRTIVSVTNGRTIELDQPLDHLHYGGVEYQVEVGLLSHNIVFRTADAVLAAAPTFGGHIMVHSAQARVSGVELHGLGQQNFVGRYPFHFHHGGGTAQTSYFTDSSIWRSNWRCAVIHRTDNAIVSRNVAYDVFGHCYYIEDGVERGNEISFNLAARIKIMGPTDPTSLAELNTYAQEGFVLTQSADMANPADRAAAGFYITNGNNTIMGNAASGGFAGYSLPNLPKAINGSAERIYPINYGAFHFDGNSAHTAGYFWDKAGCIYAGGVLTEIDDNGQTKLQYQSGRPAWSLLRQDLDVFTNNQTFLCTVGITHWGLKSKIVNFEAWDSELMAKVFGSASIQSAIVAGQSGNTANLTFDPVNGYRYGFQFYDTGTQTILRGILFRDFHPSAYPGSARSQDNCALWSLTHSDQYTPQRMSTSAEFYFLNVDDSQRFCHDDTGALASRNFNLNDTDGTATGRLGDGILAGPRIVGAAYTDIWKLASDCVRDDVWGVWMCPQRGTQNVASISTTPNKGVQVVMYDLTGATLGQNYYSATTEFAEAQISGPSEVGWHHIFPGGIPDQFDVWALQVPKDSYVLLSVSLPAGVSCSIPQTGWQAVADLPSLLGMTTPAYTTDRNTCFVRIPWTDVGTFDAAGLSIPNQAWRGFSTTTNFTVVTGCNNANPDCQSTVQAVPILP